MPVNYQLGKIYKIESYQTDDIYIGSTCEPYLSNRLSGHKKNFRSWKKGKDTYRTSFEILKYDDAFITLIELNPCNSKAELEAREGHWIRQLDCVNKITPGRTHAEYYMDNKEKIDIKNKKWGEDNQERKKKYIKQYKIENREEILKKSKQYYEQNKQKIKEKHFENKDDINTSRRMKYAMKKVMSFKPPNLTLRQFNIEGEIII